MEQVDLTQWLVIILGLIGILKFIADLIMKVKNPNIEQDKELLGITKDVGTLQEDVKLIRVNHLDHLEADVKGLREGMVRIETILEERLPKK